MRNRSKLLMAAFAAALLMSFAVSAASAGRLSVSNNRIRVTWSPLSLEPGNVSCNVTLEGSFHSNTIQKVAGALVGYISRAIVAPPAQCTNGEATIVNESLPWHIRYRGITGALPRFSGVVIGLVGARFRVHVNSLGATCEVLTTPEHPGVGTTTTNEEGRVTGLRVDENARIPLLGLCGAFGLEGSFTGTGAVTLLNASTPITIRLI